MAAKLEKLGKVIEILKDHYLVLVLGLAPGVVL